MKKESDPNGKNQHEMGAKLDAGKPKANLLLDFGEALMAVAEVATYGAEKYTEQGWEEVPNGFNRYTGALVRHLLDRNELSSDGLMCDAQVAWNALARLELKLRKQNVQSTGQTIIATVPAGTNNVNDLEIRPMEDFLPTKGTGI